MTNRRKIIEPTPEATSRIHRLVDRDPLEQTFWEEIDGGAVPSYFTDDLFVRLCMGGHFAIRQGLADRMIRSLTPEDVGQQLAQFATGYASMDVLSEASEAWQDVRYGRKPAPAAEADPDA